MTVANVPDRGQSVGAFVRERRRANRLTQAELAELAGVGLRFLKELEAGKPTVRMDTVNAVLAPFGKQLGVVDRPRNIEEEDDLCESSSLRPSDDRVDHTPGHDREIRVWQA